MRYQRKTKSATWTKAFPAQVRTVEKTSPRFIRARTPSRAKQERQYNKEIKDWIGEHKGFWCPVMMTVFGEKRKISQCHHRYGRRGRLLLWRPGWMGVSDVGHDWIDRNKAEARLNGWLGPEGTYNDYEAACRAEGIEP